MHTTYNKMMNNLEALNLSVFRENLPQYLDMISLGEKSVTDALYELTEKERQFRDEKAIITQIHKSALPSGKSVDGPGNPQVYRRQREHTLCRLSRNGKDAPCGSDRHRGCKTQVQRLLHNLSGTHEPAEEGRA